VNEEGGERGVIGTKGRALDAYDETQQVLLIDE
jgi:hypothetical protein